MSRNLMSRYQELEAGADRLLGIGREAPTAIPEATETHRQVVALLNELLDIIPAGEGGPFAMVLRTLRRLEPALLRDFASVPEEHIKGFLHELGRRMLAVGSIPVPSTDVTGEQASA